MTLLLRSHKRKGEEDLKKIGVYSWYCGMAAQMDFKKVDFKKWIQQFRSQEEVEKEVLQDFKEGRELHKRIMEGK